MDTFHVWVLFNMLPEAFLFFLSDFHEVNQYLEISSDKIDVSDFFAVVRFLLVTLSYEPCFNYLQPSNVLCLIYFYCKILYLLQFRGAPRKNILSYRYIFAFAIKRYRHMSRVIVHFLVFEKTSALSNFS